MYVYTTCVPKAHVGQMKVLEPLELDLQRAVSHYVGDGNLTQVHWKSSKSS